MIVPGMESQLKNSVVLSNFDLVCLSTILLRGCSMASNRSCRSHCGSSVASAVTLAVAAVNGRRVLDGVYSTTVTTVSANDYVVQ